MTDLRRAAIVPNDSALLVWDLPTGKIIASFSGATPFRDCAISADGIYLVSGDESEIIHILRMEGESVQMDI